MELEEATGDYNHALACEMVKGIAHGKGIPQGAVGRSRGRRRGDTFGQIQECWEGIGCPEAIGHTM